MTSISSINPTASPTQGPSGQETEEKLKAQLAKERQQSSEVKSEQEARSNEAKIKELEAKLKKLKAEKLKEASTTDEQDTGGKVSGKGNIDKPDAVQGNSAHGNNLQKDPREPGFVIDRIA